MPEREFTEREFAGRQAAITAVVRARVRSMRRLSPLAIQEMLGDGEELAIIDLREELIFSQGHLLWARSVPLSRLELLIARLVPRLTTRIVLCDDDDGLAMRASATLARFGYHNLFVLAGGVAAWSAAGLELFSGVNVVSKAFGEFVEHERGTPSIVADELDRLLGEQANVIVLDCRPFDEYARMSIPTAVNVPGAELVLRVCDVAPARDTTIVVNCAGRTRSIIGAQSLIDAGVPNKVVALRNGTMGWTLAGHLCERGKERRGPGVSRAGLIWAQTAARRVAQSCGVERIDAVTLDRWRQDLARTLYLLDVRDPAEYAAGHVPGAISAPGGQLVQATDHYVGTLGARIVLLDDAEVRALMTASWLRQMGWRDVFVLAETGRETGWPPPPVLGAEPLPELRLTCAQAARLLAGEEATIVDLSLSRNYLKGHIAGAWFAIRSRLARSLAKIPLRGALILTSEDGVLAALAAAEARALLHVPVHYLAGGNAAWQSCGHVLATDGANMADDPVDLWLKPYERAGDPSGAMADYLAWETGLPSAIERDGSTRFTSLPP